MGLIASGFKLDLAQLRMMAKDGERREARLPDVKPPCSNLAGTLVPAIFFYAPGAEVHYSKTADRR